MASPLNVTEIPLGTQQMPMADTFDPRQMQAMLGAMALNMGANMPGTNAGMDPAVVQQFPINFQQNLYMQMLQYFQGMQGRADGGFGATPNTMLSPAFPMMGIPSQCPAALPVQPEAEIRVTVEGMKFQFQLTEDDLHKVFSRYGAVKAIQVDEVGSGATITFHACGDAAAAMQDLDGKVLNGLDGTLRISWVSPQLPPSDTQYDDPVTASYGGWMQHATDGSPWPQVPMSSIIPGPDTPPEQESLPTTGESPIGKGVRKYTCRFLIGIDNDNEFQVSRRIIGAKGTNMKRVVKQTEAKLRLRGCGSGYFEGAGQKESTEPLQLCVSCTNYEGYKTAVEQVEELLNRTYDEYKQFCHDSGRIIPDLRINMSENQLINSNKSGGSAGAVDGRTPGDSGGPGSSPAKSDGKRSRRNRTKGIAMRTVSPGGVDRGEPGPNAPSIDGIERLVDERNEARRAGNFAEADRIRALLHAKGVALMDEPGGRGKGSEVTVWRYWRD